jgi:transcriptional regulator with XRE-family HTH domain
MDDYAGFENAVRRERRYQTLLTAFRMRLHDLLGDKQSKRENHTDLAKYIGCSPSHITHLKNGKQLPRVDDLVALSEYLGRPIEYFLGLPETQVVVEPSLEHPFVRQAWTMEKTEQVETTAPVVWDATPDFYWISHDSYWSNCIINNIVNRQVKYYFLYKGSEENNDEAKRHFLKVEAASGEKARQLVHYVSVSPDEFPAWAEHVLYDPYGSDPRCIMISGLDFIDLNVPVLDVPNFEFTRPMTIAFSRWFRSMWNKRVEDKSWNIP